MTLMNVVDAALESLVECQPVDRVQLFEAVDGTKFVLAISCGGAVHRFEFPFEAYDDLVGALNRSQSTSKSRRKATQN